MTVCLEVIDGSLDIDRVVKCSVKLCISILTECWYLEASLHNDSHVNV